MIISFKLSRSLFHRFEEKRKEAGTISIPEKHILLPPVSSFFLSSFSPVRVFLALSAGTVAVRNKTNSTSPSPSSCHPNSTTSYSLHCTEQKAIKRESARLSVFIPSPRRFPGCYANNALLDHYPESFLSSCLSLRRGLLSGATHDRAWGPLFFISLCSFLSLCFFHSPLWSFSENPIRPTCLSLLKYIFIVWTQLNRSCKYDFVTRELVGLGVSLFVL